jgi:hypothetical protein
MRNTFSMVILGIGLLSPGCNQARKAAPAGGQMADRVEAKAARATDEGRREAIAGGAAGSAPASVPGGVAAPPPAAEGAMAHVAADPGPAANVHAGEWDDNANYRDYVRWLKETPRGIARLDVSGRQFVVVEDSAGKPVPNCTVTLTGGQHTAALVTTASGRALLFPHALGFDEPTLAAAAACGQATAQATIRTDQLDGVAELRLPTERALPARRTVDLAFVLDTTGSMGEEIEAVKSTIRTVAARLGSEQTDVRIGLVEYKDRGDPEVTHTYPFLSDLRAFSRSVAGISAGGGGDTPGNLDQLIVSKVKRELASLDADPLQIAGRGKDENAKPCDQRIVMAY